jgi:acetyltransferase-like isoleucine patch superfamily enzyme
VQGLKRVASALRRAGVRRVLARQRLRRQHGLVALGSDFDYDIPASTTFGPGCRLGGPVFIAGSNIGDYTYIEVGSRISAADVGKFCSIAPYAMVGLVEHPVRRFVSTHPMFYRRLPAFGYDLVTEDRHQELRRTSIGNDVWIGVHACIRGGTGVGDGAVIGAGAVVTTDVPPYAIYGGVPARLIRYRFAPDVIEHLLAFKWWDRDVAWLREHIEDMQDVDRLTGRLSDENPKRGV